MIPSLEGLPTKAKEAPSPHEVRLSPLDTNPVFHSLFTFKITQILVYGQANYYFLATPQVVLHFSNQERLYLIHCQK